MHLEPALPAAACCLGIKMVAAIFPGQGSQHAGMGKTLFDEFAIVRRLFEEASDTLKVDFKKLCFEGPESDLALTENTQPCLLLASYATFCVLKETVGFKPNFVAGHSLGEYSALTSVESLNFSSAIRAVRSRGKFMQEAVPVGKGGMLAVLGLEDEDVRLLCKWAEEEYSLSPLEPANINAPGQIVISGNKALIDKLVSGFDSEKVFGIKKRAKLIPLNVSAPFHCSMMNSAQEKMALILKQTRIQSPKCPIVQNVTAMEQTLPDDLRQNLINQISGSVLWTQSVKRLKQLGIDRIIECGPGKVLTALVKKIDSEILTLNIQTLEDIRNLEKDRANWLN